jgi:hypothetical protein
VYIFITVITAESGPGIYRYNCEEVSFFNHYYCKNMEMGAIVTYQPVSILRKNAKVQQRLAMAN